MGLFSFLANKSVKNRIKETTKWYKQLTPDDRAGMIYFIWISRGMNLPCSRGGEAKFVPIFHYYRNSEVAILDLIDECTKVKNIPLKNALYHHYFTAVASTYPDEEYGAILNEMWEAILENYTDLREVVHEMRSQLENPDRKSVIDNNDVSVDNLVVNPDLIIPHFLRKDHALTNKVRAEEILGCFSFSK